jgi:hypothetical protein
MFSLRLHHHGDEARDAVISSRYTGEFYFILQCHGAGAATIPLQCCTVYTAPAPPDFLNIHK